MGILQRFAFILLAGLATHAAADEVARLDEGLYFRVPPCLPECDAEDRGLLNEDSYIEKQVVSAIDSARKTVDFQQFTFSRKSVFDAMVRAADRGIIVRGVMDRGQFRTLAAQCSPQGCQFTGEHVAPDILKLKPSERVKVLDERNLWPEELSLTGKLAIALYQLPNGSGVKVAPGRTRLMHNKFVFVDEELLVTGSGNWSSTGMGINMENIDTVYRDSEPNFIEAFDCMVDLVWSGDSEAIAKNLRGCETEQVYFTPAPAKIGIQQVIVDTINETKSTVEISMHHLTNDAIITALVAAAGRNVKVRVMFDDDDCMIKLDESVKRLMDARIEVRYMPTECEMFQLSHNKFGIFDGVKVINGSGNWSKAGLTKSYENYIVYTAAPDVQAFKSFFESSWPMAKERNECGCNPREPQCRQRYCIGRPLPRF